MPAKAKQPQFEIIEVELRNPTVAAVWAWLWPGAGHLYQRRYAKGALFMVCILSTYFFGLALGGGRVVYASFKPNDRRWQYICQVGVGIPALPAVFQSMLVASGGEPWFGGLMAPPAEVDPDFHDQLAEWHLRLHSYFELGTLYTMIAGLLNVLAIFDAYAGPMAIPVDEAKRGPPNDEDQESDGEEQADPSS